MRETLTWHQHIPDPRNQIEIVQYHRIVQIRQRQIAQHSNALHHKRLVRALGQRSRQIPDEIHKLRSQSLVRRHIPQNLHQQRVLVAERLPHQRRQSSILRHQLRVALVQCQINAQRCQITVGLLVEAQNQHIGGHRNALGVREHRLDLVIEAHVVQNAHHNVVMLIGAHERHQLRE